MNILIPSNFLMSFLITCQLFESMRGHTSLKSFYFTWINGSLHFITYLFEIFFEELCLNYPYFMQTIKHFWNLPNIVSLNHLYWGLSSFHYWCLVPWSSLHLLKREVKSEELMKFSRDHWGANYYEILTYQLFRL